MPAGEKQIRSDETEDSCKGRHDRSRDEGCIPFVTLHEENVMEDVAVENACEKDRDSTY
jgi:hypothetical protein